MQPARNATIDIARGIAIVAIVLGHVLRGLGSAGIIDPTSAAFTAVDGALYLFHLAVFTFISGLFVSRSVDRDGVSNYVRSRLLLFLYLYLLWTVLQGAVKLITGSLVNSPTSVGALLQIWRPEGQLWYLPLLMILIVAFATWRPWRTKELSWLAVGIGAAVSTAAWGVNGPVVGTQGLGLTFFFAAGVVWGSSRFTAYLAAIRPSVHVLVGVVSAAAFFAIVLFANPTVPTIPDPGRTPVSIALGIVASLAGVAAVIELSQLLALFPATSRLFGFLGQRSLEIFLAHIIAAAGTRIVLDRLGVESVAVYVVAGTLMGVAVPLGLWWVTKRLHFPWLFAAPWSSRA